MTPADNENLQIKIIVEGLNIEVYEINDPNNPNNPNNPEISNNIKGGTINIEEKKINRNEYDDKAKLYCSRFNKKISRPVFYKGIGYYKCIELN